MGAVRRVVNACYPESPCISSLTALAVAIDIVILLWVYKLGLEECEFHRGVI
jgi:hypothetical protein